MLEPKCLNGLVEENVVPLIGLRSPDVFSAYLSGHRDHRLQLSWPSSLMPIARNAAMASACRARAKRASGNFVLTSERPDTSSGSGAKRRWNTRRKCPLTVGFSNASFE